MEIERVLNLEKLTIGDELLLRYNAKNTGSTTHGYFNNYSQKEDSTILTLDNAIQLPIEIPFSEYDVQSPDTRINLFRALYLQLHTDSAENIYVQNQMDLILPKRESLKNTRLCYLVKVSE